jgi:hypothetical protein
VAVGPELSKPQKSIVHLGDTLVVTVSDLPKLQTQAQAKGKPIHLFLNGVDSSIEPIDSAKPQLIFRLERKVEPQSTRDLWNRLFGEPFEETSVQIHVSVGVGDGTPLDYAKDVAGTLTLEKVHPSFWGWFWLAILALTLVVFFGLVRKTDILRNGPRLDPNDPTTVQPYSLGRSQMAWWLFLVAVSYVVIWMITGDRDTIPTSALILMGISAATALGAIAIDSTASSRIEAALKQLDAEKATLQNRSAALGASAPLQAAVAQRVAEIDHAQTEIVQSNRAKSSWLMDVLTDDTGVIALHRFQVLLWTFVLGAVFIGTILHSLTMPDFSPTLLALMGISSVTYLGFKFPVSA